VCSSSGGVVVDLREDVIQWCLVLEDKSCGVAELMYDMAIETDNII
jgi:hypothetical protein